MKARRDARLGMEKIVPAPPEYPPSERDNYGYTLLHRAAAHGRTKDVEQFLAAPLSRSDEVCDSGATALLLAAQGGHCDVIPRLFAHDRAQLEVGRADGSTPLTCAAANGHLEAVELLLALGANPNAGDKDAATPLMAAIITGNLQVAQLLLANATVNVHAVRKSDGANALFLAAAYGHLQIVSFFLDRPDRYMLAWNTDRWGTTPIAIAADNDHKDVVAALLPLAKLPAPMAPQVSAGAQTLQVRVFTGDDIESRSALRKAAAAGELQGKLTFVGDGTPISWDRFLFLARGQSLEGIHCLVSCHGSGVRAGHPRHRLVLNSDERVGTNEVIRVLIESGARKIDIWACRARQAAHHLAFRMECDPTWPSVSETVEVTIHGEDNEVSSGSLVAVESARIVQDMAHAEADLLQEKFLVSTQTRIRFDPDTKRAQVQVVEAATLDDVARRLPALTPAEQSELIGDYMMRCCSVNLVAGIEGAFRRFPHLVNANYHSRYATGSLLASAAVSNSPDVVAFLLKQPGIELRNALEGAGYSGNLSIAKGLLTLPHNVADVHRAVHVAQERKRPEMVVFLEQHLKTLSTQGNGKTPTDDRMAL
ncbi:MAG: ankyrin repeat domain-containing protein [Pseudomonadota bacterium]